MTPFGYSFLRFPAMVETMTLGERIRIARQRARITQEQLAEKVGKSRRTIDNWENDRTAPANLVALEDALGSLDEAEPEEAHPAVERTTHEGAVLEIVRSLEADTDDLPDDVAEEIIRRSVEHMRAQAVIIVEAERGRWARQRYSAQHEEDQGKDET